MVTRVIYVKHSGDRRFVIVDGAMNDLLRPAMYDAYHHIETVIAPAEGDMATPADIVGPICETGDSFARDRPLATVAAGDLLVVRTAGAYGAVMASSYNLRPLIPEVLVNGDRFAIIRRRPGFDEMTALQSLPDWLDESRPAKRGAA
jgi:diaminopimelate decarboxylase